MTMNITETEWRDIEAKVAAGLAQRWPWLAKPSKHHPAIRVETPAVTAMAELRWLFDEKAPTAACVISVASGRCCNGHLADIAEFARQACEVRDAMLYVHGETTGIVVYRDGECPCAWCSGKGTSQGATCKRCNGAGKV